MKRVFTNRAANVRGGTTSLAVRLPDEIVAYIDAHFDEDIANRSEFLQHWAQVGVRVSMDAELAEALGWALERNVFGRHEYDWPVERPVQDSDPLPIVVVPITGYEVPNVDGSERPMPSPDELAEIRESQLEAMRNRVR